MATPVAGSAATSSPFTAATPAGPPRWPACASPTWVTMPRSGRATSVSAAMLPAKRAPISTITAWVSAGAPASVRGTPASLLNDAGLACTRRDDRAPAARSFVAVLPAEPVTATTAASRRSRANRPSTARAPKPSATRTTARPGGGGSTARVTSATVAPRAQASGTKSWPSRSATSATKQPPASRVRVSIVYDVARASDGPASTWPPVVRASSSAVSSIAGPRAPRAPRPGRRSPRCDPRRAGPSRGPSRR